MSISPAIASRRGQAIDHLAVTVKAISEKQDIEAMNEVKIPRRGVDPSIGQMLEVEALSEWLDRLAASMGIEPSKDEQPFDPDAVARATKPEGDTPPEVDDPPFFDDEESDNEPIADDDTEFGSMTIPELRDLADERGVDLGNLRLKQDIIDKLDEAATAAKADPSTEDVSHDNSNE